MLFWFPKLMLRTSIRASKQSLRLHSCASDSETVVSGGPHKEVEEQSRDRVDARRRCEFGWNQPQAEPVRSCPAWLVIHSHSSLRGGGQDFVLSISQPWAVAEGCPQGENNHPEVFELDDFTDGWEFSREGYTCQFSAASMKVTVRWLPQHSRGSEWKTWGSHYIEYV